MVFFSSGDSMPHMTKRLPITAPLDAVIFDCDGTLSLVEGIIELARQNGILDQICALTEKAMGESGVNTLLYRQRLELVKPELAQTIALADTYQQHLTPDVDHVITTLQQLGKAVFVVSAGMKQAVEPFAAKLNIPTKNVYSVDIKFDANGKYQDFDADSPLVRQHGKAEIVAVLRKKYARIAHIGDGMNDAEAAHCVDLFIGYGGSFFRQKIADLSDAYIDSKSIASVLSFLLTPEEANKAGI